MCADAWAPLIRVESDRSKLTSFWTSMPKIPRMAKEAEHVNAAELDRPDPARTQAACRQQHSILHQYSPTTSTHHIGYHSQGQNCKHKTQSLVLWVNA